MARERAILQDLELEISHQLGDSIRDIDLNYGLTQTNFNRRVAAEAEVQAVDASVRGWPRRRSTCCSTPSAGEPKPNRPTTGRLSITTGL